MNQNKFLKSIAQISIILLASLLIVGATYAIGQLESVSEGENRDIDHGRHGGDGGFSLDGIGGFGETLIPMAFIIFMIVGGQKLWERKRGSNEKEDGLNKDSGDKYSDDEHSDDKYSSDDEHKDLVL